MLLRRLTLVDTLPALALLRAPRTRRVGVSLLAFGRELLFLFPWNLFLVVLLFYLVVQLRDQAISAGWNPRGGALWREIFWPWRVLAERAGWSGDRSRLEGAAEGPFEQRFPLLSEYLAGLPPEARQAPRELMEPLPVNFEFSLTVKAAFAGQFTATSHGLTVWAAADGNEVRVFGAGLVPPESVTSVTEWIRRSSGASKLVTAIHQPYGVTRFFEHQSSDNSE